MKKTRREANVDGSLGLVLGSVKASLAVASVARACRVTLLRARLCVVHRDDRRANIEEDRENRTRRFFAGTVAIRRRLRRRDYTKYGHTPTRACAYASDERLYDSDSNC